MIYIKIIIIFVEWNATQSVWCLIYSSFSFTVHFIYSSFHLQFISFTVHFIYSSFSFNLGAIKKTILISVPKE